MNVIYMVPYKGAKVTGKAFGLVGQPVDIVVDT